jgi:hypothetical protein
MRKIIGATGSRRDRGVVCSAALRSAVQHVGRSAIGGEDRLDRPVEDQWRTVEVLSIVGALRLEQAPAGRVLRFAVHRALGQVLGPPE